jgi:hypothetical protein
MQTPDIGQIITDNQILVANYTLLERQAPLLPKRFCPSGGKAEIQKLIAATRKT